MKIKERCQTCLEEENVFQNLKTIWPKLMDGKALLTWNSMIFTIIKTPGQLHIVLSDYYDNIVMITLAIYIFFHLIMHKYVHFLMSKNSCFYYSNSQDSRIVDEWKNAICSLYLYHLQNKPTLERPHLYMILIKKHNNLQIVFLRIVAHTSWK